MCFSLSFIIVKNVRSTIEKVIADIFVRSVARFDAFESSDRLFTRIDKSLFNHSRI